MFVQNNQNILEIGTGHLAILSIYIAKKKKANITAVDINPEFIKNAVVNAEKNDVYIDFRQSDLFSNIEGTFDIIYFNPPYVPTEWVFKNNRELYSNSIFDFTWNGGPDGCDTIRKFLKDVKCFTHKDSKVLLGVNSVFVDRYKMSMLIAAAGLTLDSIISSKCNPAKVYVIKLEKY
ncbi:MAG: methyltransferase [Methanosarcina barkeri]|nr:methyltransferase [Methanosarcina sp. ERenArc_MAG2]